MHPVSAGDLIHLVLDGTSVSINPDYQHAWKSRLNKEGCLLHRVPLRGTLASHLSWRTEGPQLSAGLVGLVTFLRNEEKARSPDAGAGPNCSPEIRCRRWSGRSRPRTIGVSSRL